MPFVCGTDRGQTAVALPGDVPTITAGAFARAGQDRSLVLAFLAVIIRYEVEIVVPEFNAVKDVIRVTRVFGFEGLCTYEVEGFVEGHAVVGKDVGNGFAGFITDDFHGFPP